MHDILQLLCEGDLLLFICDNDHYNSAGVSLRPFLQCSCRSMRPMLGTHSQSKRVGEATTPAIVKYRCCAIVSCRHVLSPSNGSRQLIVSILTVASSLPPSSVAAKVTEPVSCRDGALVLGCLAEMQNLLQVQAGT